jgi:hypothetical protein
LKGLNDHVPVLNLLPSALCLLPFAIDVAGTPIGSNDLLIAAIALSNDLTLVTHNTREFGRINGLKYEDWE